MPTSVPTSPARVKTAVKPKGRKSRPKAADCCRKRRNLIRWAELVESLNEFQKTLDFAEDDEVLDEVSIANIYDCLRCLKGELSIAVPVEW